ncbi:MAG: hypothetical protein LKJ17_12165 [Oscillospiraceae bacterium]|jgi:hypothetical protein|nr:hypothetical protein [Oscillospiraceae bacterium]
MYADFSFYSGPFGGSLISEAEFLSFERRAALFLDRITFNRIHSGWAVTDEVKMADCAIAEEIKRYQAAEQASVAAAGLKSENTDGYSVSYQDAETARAAIDSAKLEAARPYLMPAGLMDRSVGRCR